MLRVGGRVRRGTGVESWGQGEERDRQVLRAGGRVRRGTGVESWGQGEERDRC